MNKKSPLLIDKIQFYTYDCDQTDELKFISLFPYDDRCDFLEDKFLAGIALRILISNSCNSRGVRRNVSVTLVDTTTRMEVGKQQIKISLSKSAFKDYFINFSVDNYEIVAGRDYKVVVCDETADQTLSMDVIHLFDESEMKDPEDWYEVLDGCIQSEWNRSFYRSLNIIDGQNYLVRFNIITRPGSRLPNIMPELEFRIFYPDGKNVETFFREPFCDSRENFEDNNWIVECPLDSSAEKRGVCYVELLCMGIPIAGFVFDTKCATDVRGRWFGYQILPMDDYSPEKAENQLDEYLPFRNGEEIDLDQNALEKAIDDLIVLEQEETMESDSDSDTESDSGFDTASDTESFVESNNEIDEPEQMAGPIQSLGQLTGLRSVKEKIAVYEQVVRFNKMRADKGLPISAAPLHAMFLGSPGTGKTTVAKMMGSMLHKAGVLSSGHVVVRERATLLGQNYNSEAENTLAAIEAARGGILFIDEAYQLYQPKDPRDPGKFVIETLLTALADDANRDWMLILAGYSEDLMRMFDMNPGFKSRIPDTNIYTFDDFTESELMEIAENFLERHSYTMTDEAHEALAMRLKVDYAQRDKSFGNARHVVNLIQTEILPSMAVRVISAGLTDDVSLTEVQAIDIPSPVIKPLSLRQRVGFAV